MSRVTVFLVSAAASILAGMFLIASTWHLSLWEGFNCAVGVATTVGCNINPVSTPAEVVRLVLIFTALPLMAAAFSEITSIRIHRHVDKKLKEHSDRVADLLDPTTPGGITDAIEALK
jgi:hypothetical protein